MKSISLVFVSLALTSGALAHPTDDDQVDQIPKLAQVTFVAEINVKPNTIETMLGSDGLTKCVLKHEADGRDRIIHVGRSTVLGGQTVSRSVEPLTTGDYVLVKKFDSKLEGFQSQILISCIGIRDLVNATKSEVLTKYLPQRVFGGYDTFTIGAMRKVLKDKLKLEFPEPTKFED